MEELGFAFEPPSDEEVDYDNETPSESEEDEQQHQEDDGEVKKKTQSPWDFSSYTESVADEHARRSTTSIDFKISKAIQQLSVPVPNEDSAQSDSDPEDHQVMKFISPFLFLSIYNIYCWLAELGCCNFFDNCLGVP